MIVHMRYTDDINAHPFRDANGKEGIAFFQKPKRRKESFSLCGGG